MRIAAKSVRFLLNRAETARSTARNASQNVKVEGAKAEGKPSAMKKIAGIFVLGAILTMTIGIAFGKEGEEMIENGKTVSFEYTLTVEGREIESSRGREPFTYTHGAGQIIPGLSRGLEGMQEGDEKTITIAPEDAYGVVNPDAFQEVPKDRFPQEIDLKVGMQLQASTPEGRGMVVRVAEVRQESVVIDLNHPLAGKTLQFQVKVLSIQ